MENTGKVTVSTGEILYWLFFGSLLFAKGIGLYDGQAVFKLVLVFATACLALKIAIEKYTTAEMLRMLVVMALTAMTYIISGEKGMLLYGMMMIGMKYVNIKRLFTVGLILWSVAFFGITITSLFHMEDTVYKIHEKLGMGHIFRWSLGYPHPNVLQVSYIVLAIFIIYLLGDQFKLKHAFWLFVGNGLVFLYSVSYTGFIMFMVLLTGRLYLMVRKKLGFVERLLLLLVFPVCVVLSLVLPVKLQGKWFNILNILLSSRMELAWRYLKPEYMSLFGVKLSEITTESITMDNAYLSAFITYGAVPFALLCMATMFVIYKYLKEEKYLEVLIILAIAVGGLTEPFLYNTSFKNLSFVFMGALLFGNKKRKKEWCLVPFKKLRNCNREITICLKKLQLIKELFQIVMKFDWRKCVSGIAGAVLISIAACALIKYPEGYVVYRTECSDLTKNRNYYEKENPEYKDFKQMKPFKIGEEIEYFSGNIVKMEKIRNQVMGGFFGFGIIYIGYGLLEQKTKRRK